MAETVVSFVFDQLSTLLREEATLLGGLREEVQLISDELDFMRTSLRVAEANEEADPTLQEWIKQVREAAYDTEDILAEFMLRFARHRADGFYGCFKRIFNSIKNLRARHHIASEIRSMKSKIKNISDRRQRYQFSGQVPSSVATNDAWRYNWDDALLEEEAKLVGIEEPKQHLISLLLDGDDSQLKVISVVGMAGMGKTTLVKRVHEDVRRQFHAHAWLTVSQTCNFRELLKDLIRQLYKEIVETIPNEVESMEDVGLKSFIKDFLQEKRYVIVFDDVWDINVWNSIKFALPEGNCGNRVMITTTLADVANSASCVESHGSVYRMEPLSFEESWTLFCRKTFGDHGCPEYLMDVSKSILSKCEGLPLAIVVISGFLALKDKSDISEWEAVKRSLGSELEGSGKLDKIKKIISLSYNHLPYYLKTCLLYLSIFPEDHRINCKKLTQLWIAEGFAQRSSGVKNKEIAWDYLNELINRSLVQVINGGRVSKRPRTIRIHDLLREIIVSKSREQNLVTFKASGKHTRCPEEVRRLVIGNFAGDEITGGKVNSFKHLRSLINFGCSKESLHKSLGILCGGSRLLRVLDLEDAALEEIPDEVFNLFHLRYLSLVGTRVKSVSKSIGKLQNLVFLNLIHTQVRELPKEILKLLELRHLMICSCDFFVSNELQGFEAPYRLGGLVSLRTLKCINADTDGTVVREIGKLTQLRTLGITKLRREQGKDLCSSLEKLTKLKYLAVSSIDKDGIIDLDYPIISPLQELLLVGGLKKVPQWVASRQGLTAVSFVGSQLMDDPLEHLQHLPNLRFLGLREAYQSESICFKSGGFAELKEFNLVDNRVKRITIQAGALPHLQDLNLSASGLEDLSYGIQHLTSHLQSLTLLDVSESLANKLQNVDEVDKIAKIPLVRISYMTQDGRAWYKL